MRDYYVYILANHSRMLYVGVTDDLERRMSEHKQKLIPGYAARYNITHLVHYEAFLDPQSAIAREKHIKGWLRSRKIALIESANPDWRDLSEDWSAGDPAPTSGRLRRACLSRCFDSLLSAAPSHPQPPHPQPNS
jgi:putative endonuclease